MQRIIIKQLGREIKIGRARQGITVKDLAEKVGVSHQAIVQYSYGRLPSLPTFLKIARELDIDLGILNDIRDNVESYTTVEKVGRKSEEGK